MHKNLEQVEIKPSQAGSNQLSLENVAAVLSDAIIRLLPGVLNDETSALTDSFQDDLLAPPVYTRPADYKGLKVPEILLSGHTQKIEQWREQQARQQDKPRNRVVADKVLLEIALHQPGNTAELSQLHDMHPRIVRVYGEKLLGIVREAENLDDSDLPPPLPQPLPR